MTVPRPCEVDGCEEDALDRVCGGCHTRFETALRAVPDLEAELEVTRTRQDRIGPDGPVVTSSPSRPLPWNARADEASAALWAALAGWYRIIAPELPDPPPCDCAGVEVGPRCWDATCWAWETDRILADRVPDPVTTTRLAAWLVGHVPDVLRHPDASFVVSDVLDATGRAFRAIDSPMRLAYAGPCGCGTELYANPKRATVTCAGRPDAPGCGQVHNLAERREWLLDSLREHCATATEIAQGIGELVGEKITLQRLGMWVRRAKLAPVGEDGHGRARYRIGDVLDLLAARAASRSVAVCSDMVQQVC